MPITESADEGFASKAMGDGIAVDPEEGLVYAPCRGTISMLFPTYHAIGIKTEEGAEFLIHIGIDTVKLNGKGFTALVEEGAVVEKGQKLIQVDLAYLKSQNINPQTMLMLTDGEEDAVVEVYPTEQGEESKTVMMVKIQ